MKMTKYAVAVLGLIALLTPTSKADTFVYQVTSDFEGLDVTFDLPSFQESVTTTTFTTQNTSNGGPLTLFSLSGTSTADCSVAVPGGMPSTAPGPCFGGINATTIFVVAGGFSPSFTGPGTFTATLLGATTTVTITDVPGNVPEPSSLALIPFGLVALLVMRKRMTPQLAR